jgi:arabinose-5-phosphate isomerase
MPKAQIQAEALETARSVFADEIKALEIVAAALNENFQKAVDAIVKIKGMGKSGHIGAKIAATLASTGTPAFFVHPAEMGHGDLGMLTQDDAVIAISFSGKTDELRKVLSPIKRLGVPLISITGNADSVLGEFSDCILLTPITKEACPLDLAPTSSTTAALVMGDALAIALMRRRDFREEDFARSHPLGSLGKSLLLVSDLMRKEQQVPAVQLDTPHLKLLEEINAKRLGLTTVVDKQGKLKGIITDGDLRRAQIKFSKEIFDKQAQEIMATEPKTINANSAAITALKIMEEHRISNLIVLDAESKPCGIVDLKDFLQAGLL